MDIETFDLNLLRVFLAVARHRNVTQAGAQLGLTQSTVSHALARLRALCNDPLFVRTSEGMLPTAPARAMIEPLEQAFAAMHSSLRGAAPFEPASTERVFTLLLSDIGQVIYLPALLDCLRQQAPRVSLNVLHIPLDTYREALTSGRADMAVGHLPTLQSGFRQVALFDDPYVCMLRADHPTIGDTLSFKQYLEASHIVVEPPGRGPGLVEQALSRARKRRHIVMRLPHFFAGPLILRRTDCLMTVPRRVRDALSDLDNIRFAPLPFKLPPMNVKLLWHEHLHHDPGHRWLRALIAGMFAERRGR